MYYIFDIEVYPNYFLFYALNKNKEVITFQYWELEGKTMINEIPDLIKFIKENKDSFFIGYNSLGYDCQIIEYILKNPKCSTADIKNFSNELISSEWPIFRSEELFMKTIDLMRVNNYGHLSAKSTSLKKLEFNLRKKNIKDLPYHHEDIIDTEAKVKDIVKYCDYDVETTVDVLDFSKDLIKMREDFGKLNNLNLYNSPEPDIVKKYFAKLLSHELNVSEYDIQKLKSYPLEIKGKEIILKYINIQHIKEFKEVYDFYYNLHLLPTVKSKLDPEKKIINLKNSVEKIIEYNGTEYVYAAGGLHGCIKPGVYESSDEYIIEDFDKVSYYPHFGMKHRIAPSHFDPVKYSKILTIPYEKRKEYPKKTHYLLNNTFKIVLNTSFGLSNSEYGFLFDTKCTLATTVNGMLTLTMLLDNLLSSIPNIKVLQANTDGITIMYPRVHQNQVHKIYDSQTTIDSIPYEVVEYTKMIIKDVNNYISIDKNGDTKTKGVFEDYNDIVKLSAYHKDTSAMIIPTALKNYFINNISIEDSINNCNDIYEFCYGVKGSNSYKWHLTNYDTTKKVAKSELFDHRFIRYYAGGTQTLSQLWVKGKKEGTIQAVQASTPVSIALYLPKKDILDFDKSGKIIKNRYPNLDKQWYIDECYKILNDIEIYETI